LSRRVWLVAAVAWSSRSLGFLVSDNFVV
jgi:hypothetical protein